MLPLAGDTFPKTAQELKQALEGALEYFLELPSGAEVLTMDEAKYPNMAAFEVDLTNSSAKTQSKPLTPTTMVNSEPAFSAKQFSMKAEPLKVNAAEVQFNLQASQASFDYSRDKNGQLWLVPSEKDPAKDGEVNLLVSLQDLQEILMSVGGPVAKQNGVTLEDAKIELEQNGPTGVRGRILATGKKFGMRAHVHVDGRLQIDEELNAAISELSCGGDGFLGSMASSLLQPILKKYDGTRVPLAAFSFGSLKLRDIQVAVDKNLKVSAAFGV